MRHYSAAPLGEADLKSKLHERLGRTEGGRRVLADELGITPFRLSGILRGRWPIDADIAAALGFRKVVRFEPMS